MTTSQPDYYQVLGLEPNVTQDALKKRYRELARRYHPDINPTPEAAHKIKEINEAYHVLGDADLRSTYDANRAFQVRSTPNQQATGAGTGSRTAPFAHPADFGTGNPGASDRRPVHERVNVEHMFNGFGRVDPGGGTATHGTSSAAGSSSHAPGPNSGVRTGATSGVNTSFQTQGAGNSGSAGMSAEDVRRAAARKKSESNAAEAKQLLEEAQLEFINRQYSEAEELCRKVIALDRRNAVAYALLGDVSRKLGNTDAAIQAYTFAIQLNPRNAEVQTSLDRLMGTERAESSGPKMARRSPRDRSLLAHLGREAVVNGVGAFALAVALIALAFLYQNPGIVFALDFSLNLVGVLIACGLASGVVLAIYGGMRPQSRELLMSSDTYNLIPFRGVLVLLSMIWSGVSLIAYVLIAVTHNRLSNSVLRAYALTLILSVVVVALYRPYDNGIRMGYSVLIAAFAGNILFPTVMLGWHWGDRLRFRSFRA